MDATERIAELERRNAELEAENQALKGTIKRLEARIRDLELRLRKNSSNSSKPPSSDPPGTPPRASVRPPSGRKPGGQPGHPPANREIFPKEQVDEFVTVAPKRCKTCRRPFPPEGTKNRRAMDFHQVVDIPPASACVTEYGVYADLCPCGAWTQAELPPEVGCGIAGPRLQAIASTLSARFRISRREVVEALVALYGPKAQIALGTVKNLEDQTAAALAPVYEEASQAAQSAEVAHVDETGWSERGRRAWLWVMVTSTVCLFLVHRRRNRDAFAALIGTFAGILVSDRWKVYYRWGKRFHQLCWAHLKRDWQGWKEMRGTNGRIGAGCLACEAEVFALWHRFKAGEISRRTLIAYLRPVQRRLRKLLRRGLRRPALRATGKELLAFWPCLWVFACVPGVEPTNNTGEQAIRPAVLWRKGCFGSWSADGARFTERMLTVVGTLRKQGRAILDFLVEAITAFRQGRSAPSLLPVGSR